MTAQAVQTPEGNTKTYYLYGPTRRKVIIIGEGLLALLSAIEVVLTVIGGLYAFAVFWLLMLLGCAFGAYVTNVARLIVSPTTIEWHTGYYSFITNWDNVEQIMGAELCLRERPAITGFFGQFVLKKQPPCILIPFGRAWKTSPLGEDIQQFAPHLV